MSDTYECPHCGETFTKGEATYDVCLDCGEIFPPGEDWVGHGPGPIYENEDDDWWSEWPCNMALTVYSEADALEKQADVRSE